MKDRNEMINELAGTDKNVREWLETLSDNRLANEYQIYVIDAVVEKVFEKDIATANRAQ